MHTKRLEELPLNAIMPNRFQPRIHFDESKIEGLAKSIMRYGVLEPIIVRPVNGRYEIIAGERRFKASKLAGKNTIPAMVVDYDDKESIELALLENVQRQELTAIEEAIAYRRILDMGYITQEELAKKTGKSQPTIANKMRLLALEDETQEALINHKISERHARSLLKLSGTGKELEMLNRIINERLTVRDTDREIAHLLSNPVEKVKKENFSNVEKLINPSEKRGKEIMDIERIMQEAQNINEEEKPKNMNEFVSTPAPYDTVLGANVQTNVEEPVVEQNKFVNFYNQPTEPKTEEPVVTQSKPDVTFDSIFNSVFETNNSTIETPDKTNEEAILDNLLGPDVKVIEKEEIPSFNIETEPVNSTLTTIEPNIQSSIEVPTNENLINEVPVINASAPVVNDITKEPVITPTEEIPSFTSTIAESAPDFVIPANEQYVTPVVEPQVIQEPQVAPVAPTPEVPTKTEEEMTLEILKKCEEELQKLGLNVTTNKLNLGSVYQFTFNIIK